MIAHTLLAAALGVPLLMLAACGWPQLRERMAELLPLAPVPALAAALLVHGGAPLVLPWPLLRATLSLEQPAALLLGAVALLWILAAVYARTWLRGSRQGSVAVWWLATLSGNIGVFIAADLVSFYLTFSLVSLAAYGLIVHDATPDARRAGGVTLALALLGEAFLLLAFVLLAVANGGSSLLIRDVVTALPGSLWPNATIALLIAGFGLKMALVPLHVWMPLAYTAAPPPAAAVLSGAVVKAGVIGLLRFLPFDAPFPVWGEILTAAGFVSAFYGVAVGLTQDNPKTVLAYSSISQMGVIAAVLGMGLMSGDPATTTLVAFYAAHHVLAKGGLFLAIGVAAAAGAARPWPVLIPAAVLGLGIAGLPFTGGALAKLAVKGPLGDGTAASLAALSAVASAWLMIHFLHRLRAYATAGNAVAPPTLVLTWLCTAAASIAVSWMLYPLAVHAGASPDALSPKVLLESRWPILAGAALATAARRWGPRLPRLPAGDIVVSLEKAAHAATGWTGGLERADANLRRWSVAGTMLLALVVLFGAFIAADR